MKKRILTFGLSVVLIFAMVACSKDSSTVTEQITEETQIIEPVRSEAEIKLYEEFHLLNYERQGNDITNGFVKTEFVVQNKSDRFTLSNFSFEYLVDDGKGNPLDEVFRTDEIDGLFGLRPRQKTNLSIQEYIGSDINDDMRIFLSSYSYDLDSKRYTVDVINEIATVADITDDSTVSFEEKDVIIFDEESKSESSHGFINGGSVDIKTLEVSVAVCDENNVVHKVITLEVIAVGDAPLASGENEIIRISDIYAEGGYLVPVRYSYGVAGADEHGFNVYEINLITGEAFGSTNAMILENIITASPSELKAEIEKYTDTFGKQITETEFEGYEIDVRVGSEWLHFRNSTLFGVKGTATLVRDYDTLLLTDFWFTFDNKDDASTAQMLKSLELVYGDRYRSESENGKLSKAIWEFDNYSVELEAGYGIHIDSDIN